MTREQILALAERCEKAARPDRGMDDAIATALFTEKHRVCIKGLSDEAGGMWMFRYPNGSIGSSLRFTASLDAAITLVPEGWTLFHLDGPFNSDPSHATIANGDFAEGSAATPALALTSACLRAIAEGME